MLIHKKFISQKPTMIILKQRKKEKLIITGINGNCLTQEI